VVTYPLLNAFTSAVDAWNFAALAVIAVLATFVSPSVTV
jgi:hypothetical protein